MNNLESFHNPVSLTIPDDALSVKELFQRYTEGTLERQRAQMERRLEFDSYNSSDLDFNTPEDADIIDRYENAWDESFVDPRIKKTDDQTPLADQSTTMPVDPDPSDTTASESTD